MFKKILLLILIAGFFTGGGLIFWLINLPVPDFGAIDERLVAESTKIYDRTGEILLYQAEDKIKRRLVGPEEISKHLKNATVAIEDDEFYEHRGVKIGAMFRAFFVNLGAGRVRQGGSTITQQLVKNSLLTQERKIIRKIKEIFLALKLEQVMSKEEILGWYLNEAPYGGSIYGAAEASRAFFGRDVDELSLTEAAYLAAIPKAPTYYSPYGNHRAELETRKDLVLGRMRQLGFITPDEYHSAKAEKVVFQPWLAAGIKAPHFVIWVLSELEDKYGREAVRQRGFRVTTTLDFKLQQAAEEAVATYAESNEKNFNAKNAGLVALDPKTGQVLAMVGSRDYFDQTNDGNFNVTLAHRQPGSAFKPFVYATAFNNGYTPETMLFDLPTQFDTNCRADPGRCYTPSNYDDRYRGPISLRQALAQSINVPSIKVLYLAGLQNSIQTAQRMGIESLMDPNRYGLTLVLGGGEVSPLELTAAYGVFANDGVINPTEKILKIEDRNGQTLFQFAGAPRRALPENSARLISDILSDDAARVPTFQPHSLLYFTDRPVAVKTGTTNDYRDAWVIGYTPQLVAGAWVGNNDNSAMAKKIAGLIVTPLWRHFFDLALKNYEVEKFIPPQPSANNLAPVYRGFWTGNQNYLIDKISGKLATEHTPSNLQEEKVVKQVHSILYWLNRRDDPQFLLWEEPIRQWVAQNQIKEEAEAVIPRELDDVHRPELAPLATITLSPEKVGGYGVSDQILIRVETERVKLGNGQLGGPATRTDFFLNDNFLGTRREPPFVYALALNNLGDIIKENSELKVVVYDNVQNQRTVKTELVVKNLD